VSFARAMELGAAMIECDLQLTADGHVVVFHDWTVDRTTDGSGAVREMTLAELRALDAGSWRDARFAGERIPTLEEILDATEGRVALNLELKSQRGDAHLALAVMAGVTQRRALERVLLSSFHPALLEQVREASPHAAIAVLCAGPPFDDAWSLAGALGAVALHPGNDGVSPEVVREAHDRGLRTNVWTVNRVERMLELLESGVDGLISDFPARLLEARARLLAGA